MWNKEAIMESDLELLELAAKAAGLELTKEKADEDEFFTRKIGSGSYSHVWDPLNDDGDALRLAVKLDIGVRPFSRSHENIAFCAVEMPDGSLRQTLVPHGGDPFAATRRAVVRAAAEIGKSM
jgi:hypothetical protein